MSLETRRVRGDLIEVFKIMKWFDNVNSGNFFSLSDFKFRSHSLKLSKPRFNLNVCKFNFTNREVDVCSRLDQSVIDSGTIYTFKDNRFALPRL